MLSSKLEECKNVQNKQSSVAQYETKKHTTPRRDDIELKNKNKKSLSVLKNAQLVYQLIFSPDNLFFQRFLQSGKLTFWHCDCQQVFEICVPQSPLKTLECKMQSTWGKEDGQVLLVQASPSLWHANCSKADLSKCGY